ncbi:MAG: hypothetical protein KBE09_02640 [Candidatus Pacebacteria bacterium]|nr:hypothetical protein [Candidatus Paceibacterota bacterium]
MTKEKIIETIIELASEDAYGSWELWGSVKQDSADGDTPELRKQFLDATEELVRDDKLSVMHHKPPQDYPLVQLERSRLEHEIEHSGEPDPDNYYWFKTTKKGEEEDIAARKEKF